MGQLSANWYKYRSFTPIHSVVFVWGAYHHTRKTTKMSDNLINLRYRRPDALCRLFCFPWAGGGTAFYSAWGNTLPETVEVCPILLPGREKRYKDPMYKNHTELVQEICSTIVKNYSTKQFAFFGHSFGAAMSFETARVLKEKYNTEPVHLFVSGTSAPHSPQRLATVQQRNNFTDEEYTQWIIDNGGTPKEILENKDALNFFIPVIRGDLRILDHYSPEPSSLKPPPLSCPISAFDGDKDRPHDMQAFHELTTGAFNLQKLPGGHFYLHSPQNEKYLLDYIMTSLEDVVPGVIQMGSSM